jgi:RNA polymerase sigma-70 factor (ECF subfamily)
MATNYELVADAQEYLKDQVAGIAPDSGLLDSWDEFFGIYDAIIRRFAVASHVPRDEVEECTQEVWTAVVSHLDRFEADPLRGRFRTWLYQIVRSKSTDLIRRRARRAALSLNDSRFEFDLVSHRDEDLNKTLEESWRKQSLRVLLGDLKRQVSPTSYELFELRAVRGKSFDDLARHFEMTPSAVRTRYHRTLKRFRQLQRRYTGLEE